MKILIFIFLLFFSHILYSNEIEVIEIHENKSFDQIVLELDNKEVTAEKNIADSPASEDLVEINQNQVITNEDNNVQEINIEVKKNFFDKINYIQVNQILNNAKNIKSKSLQNEFINFLINLNLDYEIPNNRSIFKLLVNYFYDIGDISKSYFLIKSRNIDEDENKDFYDILEINYLLSTSQLENACNLKNEVSSELFLQNNYIDKIEIFCLVLKDKNSEAELLNSIMLETEDEIDENFQKLISILLNEKNINIFDKDLSLQNYNNNLIFLYSAMAKIAEVPLNEDFLKVDPLNLAIPIILNKYSPIDLRLQAANKSFLNGLISKESLAALYQSVDFDSFQLNNPDETIKKLSKNIELQMAYYFQFINIQIFPSERLYGLINFWNFAKENNLENIAYSLSNTIVDSIEIASEYLDYSPQIAMSYISNNNLDKAINWMTFYENTNGVDDKSILVNMLINFHSSNEISKIVDNININYENLNKFESKDSKDSDELFFVLFSILNNDNIKILEEGFENLYDERLATSLFISENIQNAIDNKDQNKFLIYSIISINNKEWNEIHPSHLKLLLKGFLNYRNGILVRDIILEIFEDYKLI